MVDFCVRTQILDKVKLKARADLSSGFILNYYHQRYLDHPALLETPVEAGLTSEPLLMYTIRVIFVCGIVNPVSYLSCVHRRLFFCF